MTALFAAGDRVPGAVAFRAADFAGKASAGPSSRSKFGIAAVSRAFGGPLTPGTHGGHGNESKSRLPRRLDGRKRTGARGVSFFRFAFPFRLQLTFSLPSPFSPSPSANGGKTRRRPPRHRRRRTYRTRHPLRRKEQGAPRSRNSPPRATRDDVAPASRERSRAQHDERGRAVCCWPLSHVGSP